MGQSFSVEELHFVKAKQGQKVYPSQDSLADSGTLDELLEEIDKRIARVRRSAASKRLVFYTRHRTHWGAPTVNRRSYNEDEIRRFEVENDGFPMAATEDEIRQFDEQLFTGKRRNLKKKSWSFSEVIAQRSIRFPVISRPKFVDRIITGYSSLTRRSPCKLKHSQRSFTRSLDHSSQSSNDPADVPSADCVVEEDDLLVYDREVISTAAVVKFCFKCDLPVLFEDINTCTLPTDNSLVICFSCQEENNGQPISEACVLSEHDDDGPHASITECSEWLHDDPALLEPPISELILCESGEVHEYCELADVAESNTQVADHRSRILNLHSLVLCDNLRQHCEGSHNDPTSRNRTLRRSKSDRCGITSIRDLQKQSLGLQAEESNLWPKNYYSIFKESTFSEAVMAKGYVRALAEQINQQGTLKVLKDEDNEAEDSNSEMSKSTSSIVCVGSDEVQINLVHKLIEAAEQQKLKDERCVTRLRRVNAPAKDEVDLNSISESDCTGLINRHLGSESLSEADIVHSLYISAHEKTLYSKSSEAHDNLKPSTISTYSQLIASEGQKSSNSSPCSPLKTSPMGQATLSQSATKSSQFSYSKKSVAKRGSKPKVPPKPALKAITSALSSDSALSPQSPFRTTPQAGLPEASSASSSRLSSCSPPVSETLIVQPSMLISRKSPVKSSPRVRKQSATKSPSSPPKIPITPKSPKSPKIHSPKSSTICSDAPTSISQQPQPSVSSAQKITLSPNVTPLHSSKSPPPSPNLPIIPSLVTAVASAFLNQPSSPVAANSPRPTCAPPRRPLTPSSVMEPTAVTNKHTDPVEQWLNSTHGSLAPDTSSDGVSMRTVSKRNSEQYRDSVFQMIYDNPASLTAAELFDSSWSDSDSSEDVDDNDDDDDEGRDRRKKHRSDCYVVEQIDTQEINSQAEVSLKDKRFRIAQELLQTEKDYVAVLHLLHNVFYSRLYSENEQQSFLPADALNHMFSNTKSIFLFHNDFLLPQLENRMQNWEQDPRIGDLMKKNAPFLKMYTEYIRNFDRAMKLINQFMEKSTKFSEIIQDIQKLPECRHLSLQHHMLGPIQRVPRYELLLKDYVRHLPEDSPDMSDAKDALDLVTKAACHSNEAMKKIETFHKLLDIYQSLRGVPVDFISPAREFVTQGPVTKIAARSGEKQLRHLFLFNDLVLVCIQYNLLGTYSVRSQLELDGMEIKPGTSMNIPNTFLVHSKQKAVELLDESPTGEVFGWQEKIQTVISNYKKRKGSIKQEESKELTLYHSVPERCLGKTAPVWIQDDAATMCMVCMLSFNMVRRRHHCRACGKLICKTCCKKAPLEYNQGKIERVCTLCYDVIVNKGNANSETSNGKHTPKKKGILQVNASTGLLSGYMNCSDDGGHSWQKFWVAAHDNFVIYTFRAHEDVSAVNCVPLPGYEVGQLSDIAGRQHVFCLSHKKKIVWIFQTDNDRHLRRWISLLSKLSQAQLPDENCRLSSLSNSSNSSSVSDSGINNGIVSGSNKRGSTYSGSQADSGYPGDSTNSLSLLAADDNDHESPDLLQADGGDGVFSE